ncbi:MAG: hypothetical protein LUE27_09680 [Clostridia bacterium]|nr:hypothetical protein [Clostridia bacterium]
MSFWNKKGQTSPEEPAESQPSAQPAETEQPAKERHGWHRHSHEKPAEEEQPVQAPAPEPAKPEQPDREKHGWRRHSHAEQTAAEQTAQAPVPEPEQAKEKHGWHSHPAHAEHAEHAADDAEEDSTQETREIRHTINAEETFTLAKDVYDIRNVIKRVYSNRAVIARRLNIITLTASAVFTVLYAIFVIFGGILGKLTEGLKIYAYIIFAVYAAVVIAILAVALSSRGARTRTVKRISKAMKYLRLILRLLSLAVSITAIAFATSDNYSAAREAWDIVVLVLSIIILIIQIIPLLFGGALRLCRWLMSPVKAKYRFNAVALEWYDLVSTDRSPRTGVKRVPKKFLQDVSRIIDDTLIPALGRKYMDSIKPTALYTIAASAPDGDRPVVEGILKSIFGYAAEFGYVAEDPCRDLGFEGSIEEEIRKHKTLKERLFGVGEKVGKKALDKFINSSTEEKDKKK